MRHPAPVLLAAIAWVGPLACAALETLSLPGETRAPSGPLHLEYRNAGALPVYGAEASSPGPRIFAELLGVPRLTAFLRAHDQPDTLEVTGDDESLRILLRYTRAGNPPPRQIVVERVDDRLTAFAPTHLDGSPLGGAARAPAPERPPERSREAAPEASPPEPVAAPTGEAPEEAPAAKRPPPPTIQPRELAPLATELQVLECPIDPERSDCAALCRAGGVYEWCP